MVPRVAVAVNDASGKYGLRVMFTICAVVLMLILPI